MTFKRVDHIGIIVNDLDAAIAFFVDFGFEVEGTAKMEGALLDNLLALHGVKTEFAMIKLPEGQAKLEIIKFLAPPDEVGIQHLPVHAPGIRHIAFAVENLEAIVAKVKAKGMHVFSEIQNYENIYKLCYCYGPEGIILDLAEKIG